MPSDAEPDAATRAADVARLLDFLRDRNVACPHCGYDLRDLTSPTCPECRQDLHLSVGASRVRLAWFLAAIAPSMFSGIAAVFAAIPVVGTLLSGDSSLWFFVALDGFGWASGIAGVLAMRHRIRFLRRPVRVQRLVALAVWGLHVAALLAFLWWAIP